MREVMLTITTPDGQRRMRRDLDFWELSEKAADLEDELLSLRSWTAIQAARIKTLEAQLMRKEAITCAAI